MTDDKPLSFRERRKQQLLAMGKPLPPELQDEDEPIKLKTFVDQTSEFSDYVPEDEYQQSDADQLIENTINSIEILDAYQTYIGKEIVWKEDHLDEGMHVSCPMPNHPDKNPSAWINKTKKTWFCGACEIGGDVLTLAAIAKGYNLQSYQDGVEFVRLRESVAADHGVHTKRTPGGQLIAWTDEPQPTLVTSIPESTSSAPDTCRHGNPLAYACPTCEAEDEVVVKADEKDELESKSTQFSTESSTNLTSVVTPISLEIEDEIFDYPSLDWKSFVPQGTFLHEYLTAASIDDSPEEYHFWNGMIALAHAAGKKVTLSDDRPVYGNLQICLLGETGMGKSKSRAYLEDLVEKFFPFNQADGTGVLQAPQPGSGEALVDLFSHPITDPSTGRWSGQLAPINGFVDFDEFSGILSRIDRQGGTLEQILMGFADTKKRIAVTSRKSGVATAENSFCSILATTQPRSLRGFLNKNMEHSGFLNRWIFAPGIAKESQTLGGLHSNIHVDMSRAEDQYKFIKGWAAKDRVLLVSSEALHEVNGYLKNFIFPLKKKENTDLLKRLDLMYKKMLLILTINMRREQVPLEAHYGAKAIVEYMISAFALVHTEIGKTISHEIVSDIERAIVAVYNKQTIKKGVSAREIGKFLKSKNYTVEQIRRKLEDMEKLEYIELAPAQPGPGRPSIRYRMAGE